MKTLKAKKIVTASIVSLCISLCALLQIYHFTWKQAGYDFYHLWIYSQEVRFSDVPNFYSNKFADFVALIDHDNRFGRAYRKGAVSIGVIIHSDCLRAGHGPGVATVMTCKSSQIEPIIDPKANIADIFEIGTTISN